MLTFIDVLNEQTTWQTSFDVKTWFERVSEQSAPSDGSVSEFQSLLSEIRNAVSALHFNQSATLDWLDKYLAKLHLEFCPPGHDDQATSRLLPALRARRSSDSSDSLLRCVGDTMVLQFAQFLSECVQSKQILVGRCEGLFKTATLEDRDGVSQYPHEVELCWREEIPVLVESKLTDDFAIQRCADFFLVTPKGRFCSDSCRFTTFQITKQLKDPNYLAEKQKRYRQGKKDSSATKTTKR